MTAQEFRSLILMKKPRYAKSRMGLIDTFANKGQSKSEYSQFGPVYELFIYSFILGLKLDAKLPIPRENSLTKDFVEIAKWKGGGSLVDFLLMIVFSKSEELGFEWNDLEDMEETAVRNKVGDVISFIEDYANGGMHYLETQYRENELINSPYLFVDLLAENSQFVEDEENDEEKSIDVLESTDELANDTLKLIIGGENIKVEFKSTIRVNLHTKIPDPKIEHQCIKTIAAFMNTNGGTLLIGVSDDKEILGLNTDFDSFRKDDKLDEFQKHFDNLIEKGLGNGAFALLQMVFVEAESGLVCRVDVKSKISGPAFLRNKGTDELYIRRSASTKALNMREAQVYIQTNWGS